jgi:MSHA pilin protein MshC
MRERQFGHDKQNGFTLLELVVVITLLGVMSVVLFSRIGSVGASRVQASRDDVIAALFFAQQLAMSRPNVQVNVTASSIDVRQNGTSVKLDSNFYPLTMPQGISLNSSAPTFSYDKLGRTSAGSIQVQSSDASYSAQVSLEASGYAH